MANYKHTEIFRQGVPHWNHWRSDDPETKPNLSEANLIEADLRQANLKQADLRKADLRKADLSQADLVKADLRNANMRGAKLAEADLRGANLNGATFIAADLRKANLSGANLRRANLSEADLYEADLKHSNLSEAIAKKASFLSADLKEANCRGANFSDASLITVNLMKTDLSLSTITGSKLYKSMRDNWKIDGIKCDYVYWGKSEKKRTPLKGNYKPGEFEILYRELPVIELYFKKGFSPINFLLVNQVVNAINQKNPEFELSLDSIIFRGMPRAAFSVLHREFCEPALALIKTQYQAQIETIEKKYDTIPERYQYVESSLD
jgi:uncharacterized protein YjbI with pentapeptide repeats